VKENSMTPTATNVRQLSDGEELVLDAPGQGPSADPEGDPRETFFERRNQALSDGRRSISSRRGRPPSLPAEGA
jgi:hypothetical protein